jgi:hypothetical protein
VYHVTGKHSVTARNAQTFPVTAEITRNLVRYLWDSSTSTGAGWTTEKYDVCETTSSYSSLANRWYCRNDESATLVLISVSSERTQLLEHYAFIRHLLHDDHTLPKHVADVK